MIDINKIKIDDAIVVHDGDRKINGTVSGVSMIGVYVIWADGYPSSWWNVASPMVVSIGEQRGTWGEYDNKNSE